VNVPLAQHSQNDPQVMITKRGELRECGWRG